MDVTQSQVVQLPKLRVISGKTPIPVVKHVLRDEPDPIEVTKLEDLSLLKFICFKSVYSF